MYLNKDKWAPGEIKCHYHTYSGLATEPPVISKSILVRER